MDALYRVKVAVKGDTGLNVRLGPGVEYEIRIVLFNDGTLYDVVEISEDGIWGLIHQVRKDGNIEYGWVILNQLRRVDDKTLPGKIGSFLLDFLKAFIPTFIIVCILIYLFILLVGPPPGWTPVN